MKLADVLMRHFYHSCVTADKCVQVFLWGNLKERKHLQDVCIGGIILKLILKK